MPKLEDGEVKDFLGIASGGNVLREHSLLQHFSGISARGRLGIRAEGRAPSP